MEFIADIPTELPCLSDLENPSQLPVRKVLMILSYKLLKFSDYSCFRGQWIHCWYFYRATLFELSQKSTSTSVLGYLKGTDNCILWIFTISSLFMFSRSRNSLLIFLLSYNVWVTSIIQVNFRFERYWWFCLMIFFEIFTPFVFPRSGIPLLIFLQSYHVWVTSKIQINFRFKTYSEVLVNVSYRFLKFLHHLCFWGKWIIWWHSYWASMFGKPQKFRSPSGSRGFRGYSNIRYLTKKL